MPVKAPPSTSSTILDLVFEQAGVGLCVVAPDDTIVRANAEWLRATGFVAGRVVGEDVVELFPDTRDLALSLHARARTGETVQVPTHEVRVAGRSTWWEGRISPVPMDGGVGLLITARDVTERVVREAARSQTERAATELYEALLTHSHEAVLLTQPDGNVLRANPAACRILGRTEDEIRRAGRDGLAVPDEALRAFVAERERSGLAHGEFLVRRPDGSSFPIQATSALIPTGGGERFCFIFFRDVSATREAERALVESERRARESEERFRTLADAMPQIVCALAWNGKPEYVNRQWTSFSGLDLAATARAGWLHVLHPDDVGAAKECLLRTRELRIPQEVELRYRAAAGSFRWFLSRLAPIEDRGRIVRFIGAAMDIDDRKRAEAERERLLSEAQDADRKKNEFLAILSHELRNPLAPIRNAVYLLDQAEAGSEAAARAIRVIERQTGQLARLVDDLLDVTRISRGKIELQRDVVDLREVVRRTCDDHRALFQRSGVALRWDLPPGAAWIDADAIRVAQMLGNLLQNAAKFTPPGGTVTVAVEVDAARATVRVRDTGVGMERSQIEQMFQPFVQAERSLARTRGGLGLGLSLVRTLAGLHGGSVSASSEGPDRGSEFVIRLPLVPAPASGARPAARSDASGARLVLVVEDEADAADTLAELLALGGHRVHVARDGRSGIALARELRPDVVLCDLGLPDVDGYEVARALRADPALRSARLVALSGYALAEDRDASARAGFDEHLPKPASLDRLVAVLAPRRP